MLTARPCHYSELKLILQEKVNKHKNTFSKLIFRYKTRDDAVSNAYSYSPIYKYFTATDVAAHLLPFLNIGLGNNGPQVGQQPGEKPLITTPLGSLSVITSENKHTNQNGAINCDPNSIPQHAPNHKVIGLNIHIGLQHYPPHQPHYPTTPSLPPECNSNPYRPAEIKQPESNANLQPVSPPISSPTTPSIPVSSTTTTTTSTFSTGSKSHSNVVSSTTATTADVDELISGVFGNANNVNAEKNNGDTNTNEQQTNPAITGEGVLDIRMPR